MGSRLQSTTRLQFMTRASAVVESRRRHLSFASLPCEVCSAVAARRGSKHAYFGGRCHPEFLLLLRVRRVVFEQVNLLVRASLPSLSPPSRFHVSPGQAPGHNALDSGICPSSGSTSAGCQRPGGAVDLGRVALFESLGRLTRQNLMSSRDHGYRIRTKCSAMIALQIE